MESVWKQTGVKPPALDDLVELPPEMSYVWEYFLRLNRKRTSSGFGVNPIPFSEIESFFKLNQIEYSPDEVQLIEMLDNVAMEHFQKEAEKSNKNNKTKK